MNHKKSINWFQVYGLALVAVLIAAFIALIIEEMFSVDLWLARLAGASVLVVYIIWLNNHISAKGPPSTNGLRERLKHRLYKIVVFAMLPFMSFFLLLDTPTGMYIRHVLNAPAGTSEITTLPTIEVVDELTHFTYGRDALALTNNGIIDLERFIQLSTDEWGRPGNTLYYLLPSQFSLETRRWFAFVALLLTTICTVLIADALITARTKQNTEAAERWRWFVYPLTVLLLWVQPWFFYYGAQSLTQVPFMLLLTFGVAMWLNNQNRWATLAFSLLPLIRHEALPLVILWIIILFLPDILNFFYQLGTEIIISPPPVGSRAANRQKQLKDPFVIVDKVRTVRQPMWHAVMSLMPYLIWNILSLASRNDMPFFGLLPSGGNEAYEQEAYTRMFQFAAAWIGDIATWLFLAGVVSAIIVAVIQLATFIALSQEDRISEFSKALKYPESYLWWVFFAVYFSIHVVLVTLPNNPYESGAYAFMVLPIAPAIAVFGSLALFWAMSDVFVPTDPSDEEESSPTLTKVASQPVDGYYLHTYTEPAKDKDDKKASKVASESVDGNASHTHTEPAKDKDDKKASKVASQSVDGNASHTHTKPAKDKDDKDASFAVSISHQSSDDKRYIPHFIEGRRDAVRLTLVSANIQHAPRSVIGTISKTTRLAICGLIIFLPVIVTVVSGSSVALVDHAMSALELPDGIGNNQIFAQERTGAMNYEQSADDTVAFIAESIIDDPDMPRRRIITRNSLLRYAIEQYDEDNGTQLADALCPRYLWDLDTDVPFYPNLFSEGTLLVTSGQPAGGVFSSSMNSEASTLSPEPFLLQTHHFDAFFQLPDYSPDLRPSMFGWAFVENSNIGSLDTTLDPDTQTIATNYGFAIYERRAYTSDATSDADNATLTDRLSVYRDLYTARYCSDEIYIPRIGNTRTEVTDSNDNTQIQRTYVTVPFADEPIFSPDLEVFLFAGSPENAFLTDVRPIINPIRPTYVELSNVRMPALTCLPPTSEQDEILCLIVFADTRFAVQYINQAMNADDIDKVVPAVNLSTPLRMLRMCNFNDRDQNFIPYIPEERYQGQLRADIVRGTSEQFNQDEINSSDNVIMSPGCFGWIAVGRNAAFRGDGEIPAVLQPDDYNLRLPQIIEEQPSPTPIPLPTDEVEGDMTSEEANS